VSPFASLRSRLLVVVAAAIAPFVLYAGLSAAQAKTSADSVVKAESLTRAKAAARRFDDRIQTIELLLESAMARVTQPSPNGISLPMADSLPNRFTSAWSMAVIDTGGRRVTSLLGSASRIDAIPRDRRTALVSMAIVNERQKRNGPSTFVDEGVTRAANDSIAMMIVRAIPRPVSVCHCLADTRGALAAVLSDASVQSMLGVDSLPDGGVAVLMGRSGLPLGHIITPGRWIERDVPDTSMLGASVATEGVTDIVGLDGERRTVGFAGLTRLPWRVYVGLARAKVSAVPDQRLRDAMMLALLALTIALVGVVLASRAYSAPVQMLIADTRRLAAGALSHRTEVAERGGELGALGVAMNALASDLEQKRKETQDEITQAISVFENSPLPIWISDAAAKGPSRDRIQQANAAAARIFGVTTGALVGQRDTELFDDVGAALLALSAKDQAADRVPPRRLGRAAVLTTTATHRDCLLNVSHVASSRGTMRIVTVLDAPVVPDPAPASNTTPPMESIASAMPPQAAGEEQQALLVAFAGHIADEFTGILQGLTGYTQLASDSTDDLDMQAVALERIRALASHGLSFARQVRAFGRRDAMDVSIIDANETISALLEGLDAQLGSKVEVDVRFNVTPALVRADPELLSQLVASLIANARDAMPNGGTLSVATTMLDVAEDPDVPYAAPPGSYIVLTVADTGVGMTADAQTKMFEPFWSTKDGTGRSVGLALAAARGIALEHGWVIGVDSEQEVGTAVSIYMPLNVGLRPAESHDDDHSTRETVPARNE
jgi:signal transduction histidine kinase/HAMP domain-containing protein